ncbi:hypothetical protein ABBQ32_001253 [Trebouxia sp. C0010 RCD-2024]
MLICLSRQQLQSCGIPLIKPAPERESYPPMWMGTTVPEITDGLVSAMDQALAEGRYRPYGYVCTGAIAYDPIADGGEGPAGQSFCITALENVASQANGTSIIQGACKATSTPEFAQAGDATSRGAGSTCP